MATLFPHAGLAKLLGTNSFDSQASSVRILLQEIQSRVDPGEWQRARRATILVNGVGIHHLEGLDTPLEAEDKVWMVVPSGGG